jgi:two-component system, OmpR family, KDP operon response regulator KdpE
MMPERNDAKILVVDDERQITRVLRSSLESHGYAVSIAQDGVEALRSFEQFAPDLIITDLSMPNMDGVELTRAVRQTSQTPIIVLSVREQDHAKVMALDSGADDYITKPFSTPELLARVRVQLRRRRERREEELSGTLAEGDFAIDREAHRVLIRGDEVHLTPKEFELLLLFLQNAGRVLTHKTLLRAIWGAAGTNQPEYLRVLVAQLRKKIDRADSASYIESEPWIGYRFRAAE